MESFSEDTVKLMRRERLEFLFLIHQQVQCIDFLFQVNGVHIVKSGSNFKQFSKVTLDFKDLSAVEIESIDVAADASEDEEILKIIEEYKGRKISMK